MRTGYYTSIQRGKQRGLLLGPFATKKEAERLILIAQGAAEEVDPQAVWDAYGVTRVEYAVSALPLGRLNHALTLDGQEACKQLAGVAP